MKTLLIFFSWFLLACGFGLAVSFASPHGMAAFIYTSFLLGIIGGIGHVFIFVLMAASIEPKKLTIKAAGLIGLCFGLLSFPLATLMSEHALYFPHNLFQVSAIGYLCAVGFTIGSLVAKFIK